jgi:hypothetical protein
MADAVDKLRLSWKPESRPQRSDLAASAISAAPHQNNRTYWLAYHPVSGRSTTASIRIKLIKHLIEVAAFVALLYFRLKSGKLN